MIVVPQTEEQSEQDNNRDDRELPAAAEKNKETSESHPRGCGQKQNRTHAKPLGDRYGSDGDGDEKRHRNKCHHADADDRAAFELAHVLDLLRGHGAEKATAQRNEQIKHNRQENTEYGEAEQPVI